MRQLLLILLTAIALFGDSLASFPKDLKSMILVKQSVIPGKDVVLPPETPLFLQETVKMYNWINNGQGTKLNIFVPKAKLEAYKNHGPYEDGVTAVAIYEDQDIIFVTEHLGGETLYGTFDRAGNDISKSHPSFAVDACYRCHNGYAEICKGGTCATPIIELFDNK
jgi:hypothetical protein